jgi:LPXTG-motif cell wall-anchored protein
VTDEGPREREPRNSSDRQILLLIGIVVGLLIIGGGGYYLYKRNSLHGAYGRKAGRRHPGYDLFQA